jgi:hypothetical protein
MAGMVSTTLSVSAVIHKSDVLLCCVVRFEYVLVCIVLTA